MWNDSFLCAVWNWGILKFQIWSVQLETVDWITILILCISWFVETGFKVRITARWLCYVIWDHLKCIRYFHCCTQVNDTHSIVIIFSFIQESCKYVLCGIVETEMTLTFWYSFFGFSCYFVQKTHWWYLSHLILKCITYCEWTLVYDIDTDDSSIYSIV